MRKPIKPPISIFRSTLFILSMACFPFFFLFIFLSHSSATYHHQPSTVIQQACNATRFPHQCRSSLFSRLPLQLHPAPLQTIQSALALSSHNLKTARSMVKTIVDASAGNRTRTMVAKSCAQILHYSHYRTSLTADALSRGRTKDARAWMSAALAYQYNCWNGLKYANDTSFVAKTMSFLESLTGLSSNALAMIVSYDLFGNDTASWRPPLTERDGVWEDSGSDTVGSGPSVPVKLTPDVTVCKEEGIGCYRTVQEAVDVAPEKIGGGRYFVIYIKEGVYEERVRVPLRKRNVVFLGDGMGKTVITGSANVGQQKGMTTYNSATVGEFYYFDYFM